MSSLEYQKPSEWAGKIITNPSLPFADEGWESYKKDSPYPLLRTAPLFGRQVSDYVKPDSEKVKSLLPEKEEVPEYKALYKALDKDNQKAITENINVLKNRGISYATMQQAVRGRSSVPMPEYVREAIIKDTDKRFTVSQINQIKESKEWFGGLSTKNKQIVVNEIKRQSEIEDKLVKAIYANMTREELMRERSKYYTKSGKPVKGVDRERAEMLRDEIKGRK